MKIMKNRIEVQFEKILSLFFKDIPVCIFGVAMLFSIVYALDSYIGVNGRKLNQIFLLVGILFVELILALVYVNIKKLGERGIKRLVTAELVVVGTGLIIAGIFIQSNSMYDLSHLHVAAKAYADTGKWGNAGYFAVYSMQKNWTWFLGMAYRLQSLFGIANYRIAGTTLGIVLTFCTVFFSGKTIELLLGKKWQAIALLFLALNPTFYLFVSFYYKDIPGPMCEVLLIYLVLKGLRTEKILYFIGAGIATAFGTFIIGSTFVGLIACCMLIVFGKYRNKIKKILFIGVAFILVYMSLNFGVNQIEEWQSDKSVAGMPFEHTILMGLNGTGTYSKEIFEYTSSFATLDERREADIARISEILEDKGVTGMLQLWLTKQCVLFSNGLSGITSFSNYVSDYNALWRYTIGPKRLFFEYYAQIYRCIILINALMAGFQVIRRRFEKEYIFFIGVFGHILIHSLIETKDKYLLTFYPLLIMLAVFGFSELMNRTKRETDKSFQITFEKFNFKFDLVFLKRLCLILGSVSLVIYISSYYPLVKQTGDATLIRAANHGYGAIVYTLDENSVIEQSFRCRQSFNSIELSIYSDGKSKHAKYMFELFDEEHNCIVQKKFTTKKIQNGVAKFDFNAVVPDGWTNFTISIRTLKGAESYISIYGTDMNSEEDFYDYGEAKGTENTLKDIIFTVNQKYEGVSYYSVTNYFIFLVGLVLVELLILFSLTQMEKGKITEKSKGREYSI